MSASFSLVQHASAVGPWGSPGTATVELPDPVTPGNFLVAFLGAYGHGAETWTYPTGVADGLGNDYGLLSQSVGEAANIAACAFLFGAKQVNGGVCSVDFEGWAPGLGGTLSDGPSIIVAEIQVPRYYQIWGIGISLGSLGSGQYLDFDSQLANSYDTADSSMSFRAVAPNGAYGGAFSSDTAQVQLTMQPIGVDTTRCASNVVGLALVSMFNDVFLIGGNYNPGNPQAPYFSITNGTLIEATFEAAGGTSSNPGCSGCLAYGDFPYANPNPAPESVPVIPGLTLDTLTGLITGVPTAGGFFPITFIVTDSVGDTAETMVTFASTGTGCH